MHVKGDFHEMEGDVDILWQLRGRRGNYGVHCGCYGVYAWQPSGKHHVHHVTATQSPYLLCRIRNCNKIALHIPLTFAKFSLWLTRVGVTTPYTLLKSDVTSPDHVVRCHRSQECGSRFVNFLVNFIHDGTVFA